MSLKHLPIANLLHSTGRSCFARLLLRCERAVASDKANPVNRVDHAAPLLQQDCRAPTAIRRILLLVLKHFFATSAL